MNIKALETCEMFYNYEVSGEIAIGGNEIIENENEIMIKEAITQIVKNFEELVHGLSYMLQSLLNPANVRIFKRYVLGKLV